MTLGISFNNEDTINTPSEVTGTYYLWVKVNDTEDNEIITRSNPYKIDNIKPVITIIGNSSITITMGDSYVDEGATASDNISEGLIVNVASTVTPAIEGVYTVTYTVSDEAGNDATPVVRTVTVENPISDVAK